MGRRIDALGFDSLWSNDHLLPVAGGGPEALALEAGPVWDGWMTLAGWAERSTRVTLGCMVSGAAYRNPGLLVRMVTALDHASSGRAVLGLGAGWHEAEHRAFGYDYATLRERLDRLEEAAVICRQMLDGQAAHLDGTWFSADGARAEPAPRAGAPAAAHRWQRRAAHAAAGRQGRRHLERRGRPGDRTRASRPCSTSCAGSRAAIRPASTARWACRHRSSGTIATRRSRSWSTGWSGTGWPRRLPGRRAKGPRWWAAATRWPPTFAPTRPPGLARSSSTGRHRRTSPRCWHWPARCAQRSLAVASKSD